MLSPFPLQKTEDLQEVWWRLEQGCGVEGINNGVREGDIYNIFNNKDKFLKKRNA